MTSRFIQFVMHISYQTFQCVTRCIIAVYFYELCCILMSPTGELKNTNIELKSTAVLYTKTSNKQFIIQLLQSTDLVREGESDCFASTKFDHCDDVELEVHALHYANSYWHVSDFPFKNFYKFAQRAETIQTKCFARVVTCTRCR